MPALALVEARLAALDDHAGAALVLTVFEDERPLPGLAGQVDWRLCGAVSRWLQGGFATGAWGEHVLYPARTRLSHGVVLLVGLGPRARHRSDRACAAAEHAARVVAGLGLRDMTCGLFGLERLPMPLERSAPELLRVLGAQEALERVTLAVAPEHRDAMAAALMERTTAAR